MASKHRRTKSRAAKASAALAMGVTGAVAAVISGGSPASAATASTWDKVADCESSGRWNINSGNGYSGGLQFSPRTWSAYRLPGYPAQAYQATRQQQIRVAERVLAAQGPQAWPVCGPRAGLSRGGPAPQFHSQAAPAPRAAPARPQTQRAAVAVAYAISKISSAPYLWGGNGPVRFDCSGLTSAAWRAAGVAIPRTAAQQLAGLRRVPLSQLQPGDLVVYSFASPADHVALYVGKGVTVDTASHHPNGGVGYSTLHRAGGTIAGAVRPAYGSAGSQLYRAPAAPRTAPQRPHTDGTEGSQPVAAGTYTVVAGDWLSKIARAHGTDWPTIYHLNRDRIQDPDLIFPGQVLRMPGTKGTST